MTPLLLSSISNPTRKELRDFSPVYLLIKYEQFHVSVYYEMNIAGDFDKGWRLLLEIT